MNIGSTMNFLKGFRQGEGEKQSAPPAPTHSQAKASIDNVANPPDDYEEYVEVRNQKPVRLPLLNLFRLIDTLRSTLPICATLKTFRCTFSWRMR